MSDSQPRPGAPRPGRRSPGACPGSATAPSWSTARSASAVTPRPSSSSARPRASSASTATPPRSSSPASGSGPSATASSAYTPSTTRSPRSSRDQGLDHVDAVLFDLGVSSMQLDVRERGFAYAADAPLDMRMDGTTGPTAADVLNTYSGGRADPRPAGLRRGEVRQEDRPRGRARARGRAVHHQRPPRRAALRRDPGAGPAHRGTPGQAHVPGAAHGGQRRARRAPPGDAGGDRRDRRRRPRRRRVLPLARGPAGQAGVHRGRPASTSPRTCRSCPRAASRCCASSPAVPRSPTSTRSSRTRAPPRCGCAPSNESAHPFPDLGPRRGVAR